MPARKSLCVYCGSQAGHGADYALAAEQLGRLLAERECRLVYGGGNVGLMGILADAVLAHGGQVTGVIPEQLVNRELAHSGVRDMRIVPSMHIRKALMAEESDAFLALPGGLGTLEELCEVLTWGQLGFHHKPMGLLNVAGYFDPLVAMLDGAVTAGFMTAANRQLLRVLRTVEEVGAWLPSQSTQVQDQVDDLREVT